MLGWDSQNQSHWRRPSWVSVGLRGREAAPTVIDRQGGEQYCFRQHCRYYPFGSPISRSNSTQAWWWEHLRRIEPSQSGDIKRQHWIRIKGQQRAFANNDSRQRRGVATTKNAGEPIRSTAVSSWQPSWGWKTRGATNANWLQCLASAIKSK